MPSDVTCKDPESIAKAFKFYLQFKNPYMRFTVPLVKVQARSLYLKHKKQFDKLHEVCQKYGIDTQKYVKHFIDVLDMRENDINSSLVCGGTMARYADWLKAIDKRHKIYKHFIKSAKNIARECNELGYCSTKDFMRYLIKSKKIAEYYVTGKISLYYFAAIPNFKKIIPKLDLFARDEFHKIYDRFEMYNAEITDAFMKITNQKVNPVKYTDELIFRARDEQSSHV